MQSVGIFKLGIRNHLAIYCLSYEDIICILLTKVCVDGLVSITFKKALIYLGQTIIFTLGT